MAAVVTQWISHFMAAIVIVVIVNAIVLSCKLQNLTDRQALCDNVSQSMPLEN